MTYLGRLCFGTAALFYAREHTACQTRRVIAPDLLSSFACCGFARADIDCAVVEMTIVGAPTFIATGAFDTLPAPADVATIAPDRKSAVSDLPAEPGMGQARIFTFLVPEPWSAAMLLLCAARGIGSRKCR